MWGMCALRSICLVRNIVDQNGPFPSPALAVPKLQMFGVMVGVPWGAVGPLLGALGPLRGGHGLVCYCVVLCCVLCFVLCFMVLFMMCVLCSIVLYCVV